jgi:glycosyltransferase involved in cell wall biosynthesis
VYYGFDLARQRIPQFVALLEEEMSKQPGVTFHGRIDQDHLAREYLRADALVYPAIMPDGQPFHETFCISVVEALAAGCFPITSDHGALRETNRGGAFARANTFETEALFQLLEFWRRPLKQQANIRDHGNIDRFDPRMEPSGRRWAVEQTWARIAEQWVALCAAAEPVAA